MSRNILTETYGTIPFLEWVFSGVEWYCKIACRGKPWMHIPFIMLVFCLAVVSAAYHMILTTLVLANLTFTLFVVAVGHWILYFMTGGNGADRQKALPWMCNLCIRVWGVGLAVVIVIACLFKGIEEIETRERNDDDDFYDLSH